MSDSSCSENVRHLVEIALKNQNFLDYKIENEGGSDKGDGYASDISFVKVTGETVDGNEKILNLAVKASKKSEKLREQMPMREAFHKEIFIYGKVREAFQDFLEEKGITEPLDVVPECYGTYVTENSEALILENLKIKGFELWDRFVPMTPKHVRVVLRTLARWHGLSMALKTQKPEVFKELVKENVNMFGVICVQMNFEEPTSKEFLNARNSVIRDDEKHLLEILNFSQEDFRYAFTDLFLEEERHHVILHGDCWNSNFMFKCLDDRTDPTEVRVLDFQCSSLGSPAFDLSHFIYCCVDTGRYEDVEELLRIYYEALGENLVRLGCDPEEVFPFETLLEHWRKFSRFGLFVASLLVKISLRKADEVPDFEEIADGGKDSMEGFEFSASPNEEYLKRMRNNFLHYCKNVK